MLEPSDDTGGDCECESKPGGEEGSCGVENDVKLCWRIEPEDGIEALVGVPEGVQRPSDRPNGPQGSIIGGDEGAGEGDDE